MQSNITTSSNNGQVKKLWAMPELTLIGSNMVNGGPQTGLREKSITASSPTPNGFGLKGPFGTGTLPAAHTKHHYYS